MAWQQDASSDLAFVKPRVVYQENFDSAVNASPWLTDPLDGGHGVPLALQTDGAGNSWIASTGPWWLDPNHYAPGAGYLHLNAYAYVDALFGAAGRSFNYNGASFSFDIGVVDLVLPPQAHLNFWFQAYDRYLGRAVNYILSSVPIENQLSPNSWSHVALNLSSHDADWTPLGSNPSRTSTYAVSPTIAHALSSEILDMGIFIFLGNDLSSGVWATGSLLLDNISISLSPNGSRSFMEDDVNARVNPLVIALDLSDLPVSSFDGVTLDARFGSGSGVEDNLSIMARDGISVVGANVMFKGSVIGTATGGNGGSQLSVSLTSAATLAAVETLIGALGYANTSDDPTMARQLSISLSVPGATIYSLSSFDIRVLGQPESSGDDTYVFSDTSLAMSPVHDTGGFDTIDARGMTVSTTIALRDGSFSNGIVSIYSTPRTEIERVFAGKGNDLVLGSARDDEIHGGEGQDNLYGGEGNDSLYGDAGNDNLQGGPGADLLDGGDGFNIVYYSQSPIGLLIDLSGRITGTGEAAGDIYIAIQGVVASRFADLIYGDAGANLIYGLGGDDLIFGDAGDDTIYGGDGRDNLHGGDGNDSLYGYAGNDNLRGGPGADRLDGGDGFDLVYYSDSAVGLTVDLSGRIAGTGDAAGDSFIGIEGVIASQFADKIYGDAGANLIYGLGGDDLVFGDAGDDTIYGGDGRDNLHGGDGNDSLYGDAGNDNLRGGPGADRLDGGDGFDLVYYSDSAVGLTVDLSGRIAGTGDAAGDSFIGIEGVIASQFADKIYGDAGANLIYGLGGDDLIFGDAGDDTIYGGVGRDNLYGGDGNDSLYGDAGNDNLQGGAGADRLDGGDGFDLVYYSDSAVGLTVDLSGRIAGTGDAAGDSFIGIEGVIASQFADKIYGDAGANLIYGLGGDDLIFGDAGDDTIYGGDGRDNLHGGDGNDSLYGDAGNDNLRGGPGADRLDGGDGFDLVYYSDSAVGLTVDLSGRIAGTGDAAGDSFIGIEGVIASQFADKIYGDAGANLIYGLGGDDLIFGDAGDDTIYGGDGRDNLHGGDGNDSLYGDAGNDNLRGGPGADRLDGGDGFDLVYYSDSAVGLTVDLSGRIAGTGDAAGDSFIGIEGVIASQFADKIYGDAGANLIYGLGGDDLIFGDAGDDTLFGGSGRDIFTYRPGSGNDTIGDFSIGEDVISFLYSGTLTFQDLAFASNSIGTLATFDLSSILFQGIGEGQLTEADFLFA
ncbi:calcium-binding protein [Aurantimonas sp. E1-2-R+4]|uniref:calcium-binding protein n=1 Tax=Aurantimonas sp. E1-2-R+4 TaxID=3113714 RepID=UPI002F946188